MKRDTQSMTLSKWFGIDAILFGNRDPKSFMSEDTHKSYSIAKVAVLSNLVDLYEITKYSPAFRVRTSGEMKAFSLSEASIALDKARLFLMSEHISESVKLEIEDIAKKERKQVNEVAGAFVDRKIKTTALDMFLVEDAIDHSVCKECLSDMKARILLDAHRTLRDSLIRYC